MILLTPDQTRTLRERFLPERPGQMVAIHVIQTGRGSCRVDRWPDPRLILMESAGNYALEGDLTALPPEALRPHISGFVEAPASAENLLRAGFPDLRIWERVVYELPGPPRPIAPAAAEVRRLTADDAGPIQALSPDLDWITKTWGGAAGLAASGHAWGAFVAGSLAAVAGTFFVGGRYEEIAVVTEPGYRRLGLSGACAGALCEEIRQRGRRACWGTSPANHASIRVAEKLGFVLDRHDQLYIIGVPVPAPDGAAGGS